MEDPEPPKFAGESFEPSPMLPDTTAALMQKYGVLEGVGPKDGLAEATAAPPPTEPPDSDQLLARELTTASASASVTAAAAATSRESTAVCGRESSFDCAVAAQLSGQGGKDKDGISVPHDSNQLIVDEEKDGMDRELGLETKGTVAAVAGNTGEHTEQGLEKKGGDAAVVAAVASKKRGTRTSCYHGVTKHRWTGKYEAHLYDRMTNVESRKRKGKQVYLGSYDIEEKAARAYDLGALKYWGINACTKFNFPISNYERELVEMENMNQDEWVASLRRRSSCFSRGVSVYRGVARRKDGKWQARVGSVATGSRDMYLGAFCTEEEAAMAYDIAVVKLRGPTAITNFDISNYVDDGRQATRKLKL